MLLRTTYADHHSFESRSFLLISDPLFHGTISFLRPGGLPFTPMSTVATNIPGGISWCAPVGSSGARPSRLNRYLRGVSRARGGRARAEREQAEEVFLAQAALLRSQRGKVLSPRPGSLALLPPGSLHVSPRPVPSMPAPPFLPPRLPVGSARTPAAARVTCRPHGKDPAKVTRRRAAVWQAPVVVLLRLGSRPRRRSRP